MKKTDKEIEIQDNDEMQDHYEFDYTNAKPNRFAAILVEQEGYVKLQDDVKKIFKTSEQVNNALRAIITTYPKSSPTQ